MSESAEKIQIGEINLDAFKQALSQKRLVDDLILNKLEIQDSNLDDLQKDHVLEVLNDLLETPLLLDAVNPADILLPAKIELLVKDTKTDHINGKEIDSDVLRAINKALLESLYPNDTVVFRKHRRFSAITFNQAEVVLSLLGSQDEAPYAGELVDLSAGGLGILLNKRYPRNTYFKMKLTLKDQSTLETTIQVKYSLAKGSRYLHGIEYVTIPDYMQKKFQDMAMDFIACEERIKFKSEPICTLKCAFYRMCSKPEKILEPF